MAANPSRSWALSSIPGGSPNPLDSGGAPLVTLLLPENGAYCSAHCPSAHPAAFLLTTALLFVLTRTRLAALDRSPPSSFQPTLGRQAATTHDALATCIQTKRQHVLSSLPGQQHYREKQLALISRLNDLYGETVPCVPTPLLLG